MKVEITSAVLEQIRALCVAESNEVCGLLLGAGRRIDAILPAANVASDPSRHFELDPVTLIAAHRAARAGGPAVIGHYHSHPSGVAAPSPTDAACAAPDSPSAATENMKARPSSTNCAPSAMARPASSPLRTPMS